MPQTTKQRRKDFEYTESPQVHRSDQHVTHGTPGDAPPPSVKHSKEKLREFVQLTNPGPEKGATTGHPSGRSEEEGKKHEEPED